MVRIARDARDRERAHGRAVVGDLARDDLAPHRLAVRSVVLARQLPGRFDGLGAAGDEERAVDARRCQAGEPGGELGGRRVRERPVRVVRQPAHLLERRLPELLAVRVADLHGEQPAEHVQVALAVRVEEVRALAALDDRDLRDPGRRPSTRSAARGDPSPCAAAPLARSCRSPSSAPPLDLRPTLALAARLQSWHAATAAPRPRLAALSRSGPGGGARHRGPAGARRTPRRPAGAVWQPGRPRFPRRCWTASRRGPAAACRSCRRSHRGALPGADVDLVELRGDEAGALLASGPPRADRGAHRERPRRRPGPAARCRARPRRGAARRALPVEPAAAAGAPLGLRRPAAHEPARALLAPRSRARRTARLAARARRGGALPRHRRPVRARAR